MIRLLKEAVKDLWDPGVQNMLMCGILFGILLVAYSGDCTNCYVG